ncbi:helix-hairpin-helix domain-containing protein [Marinilabiliaceae bacterium ANBcel2]|nr:helix-hairpin-helix domain-containing protein [Marinilabiliaceae bacterium ANBcel2]
MWKFLLIFSEKEQRGLMVLIFLIVILITTRATAPLLLSRGEPLSYSVSELNVQKLVDNSSNPALTTKEEIEDGEGDNKELYFNSAGNEEVAVFINSSDSLDWQILRGIGPVLGRRIVAYRKALGGFFSVSQINEVYGISNELFEDIEPYLKIDTLSLRKIDVNSASVGYLRSHPYLDFYSAKAIVEYRYDNGGIKNRADLYNIEIPDSLIDKVAPYLLIESH